MLTTLKTEHARAAAMQRDRERNIEKAEAEIEARMRELAAQHGLEGMKDADALARLAAEDEVLRKLVVKRLVVERVGPVLTAAGYVPALTETGAVVWRHPDDAKPAN